MKPEHIRVYFSGISKRWKKKQVLDQVDIALHGGACMLITGENGSGKSTLLRILAGLLKPDQAWVSTGMDKQTWRRCRKLLRQQVMYLHQTPYLFDGTVEKNLRYVRSNLSVTDAMQWAEITHLADQSTHGLSGGERQRVALARVWLKQPGILLLDEPTANLDQESRQRTIDLLCSLKEKGVAIVIASHDPVHFNQVVNTHMHINNGKLQTAEESEQSNKVVTLLPKEVH